MHGIPFGIKDLIDFKGVPTTCGSKLKLDDVPTQDAEIVEQLKNNGAIIIGKENMHSLAYGSTGDVSHFGAVKNPLNLEKISGGSSSGSAAAIASNIGYGSIGSDTGGSIRIPSACCGVVGMKPTFGLVSRQGAVSLAPTLDTLGPITKNVIDNSLILNAVLGRHSDDSSQLDNGEDNYEFHFQKNANHTIGIPKSYFFDIIDTEIKEMFEQTVSELKTLGFNVKFIDIPYMKEFDAALSVIFAAEVYESLEKEILERPEKIEIEIRK